MSPLTPPPLLPPLAEQQYEGGPGASPFQPCSWDDTEVAVDPGDFNMCLTQQYQQCMQEDNCVFPKCLGLATKCVLLTTVEIMIRVCVGPSARPSLWLPLHPAILHLTIYSSVLCVHVFITQHSGRALAQPVVPDAAAVLRRLPALRPLDHQARKVRTIHFPPTLTNGPVHI